MCGCNKGRTVQQPPITAGEQVAAAVAAGAVRLYDVFDSEGALVASYQNSVLARAEARRTNGTSVPRNASVADATVGEKEEAL